MGGPQNTVNSGTFGDRTWSAALSYGEERNAYGNATARGPWPDLRADARQLARGPVEANFLKKI